MARATNSLEMCSMLVSRVPMSLEIYGMFVSRVQNFHGEGGEVIGDL